MKKNLSSFFILAFILIFKVNLIAQCPTCDKALADNTVDYYKTELRTDFKSVLKEIFSYDWSYYQSGAWKQNTNFQSGGTYGIISGFLDGSKSEEENHKTFNSLKATYEQTQDISSRPVSKCFTIFTFPNHLQRLD